MSVVQRLSIIQNKIKKSDICEREVFGGQPAEGTQRGEADAEYNKQVVFRRLKTEVRNKELSSAPDQTELSTANTELYDSDLLRNSLTIRVLKYNTQTNAIERTCGEEVLAGVCSVLATRNCDRAPSA
ncbi:hypothetical protein J6590_042843 [Homalodisca vitripennis]|nr:hypothetical protein J6590_042843 [Homalodisca vitripennis]